MRTITSFTLIILSVFLFFGCSSEQRLSSVSEKKQKNNIGELNNILDSTKNENGIKSTFKLTGPYKELYPLEESYFYNIINSSTEFLEIFITISMHKTDAQYRISLQVDPERWGMKYLLDQETHLGMSIWYKIRNPYYYCLYKSNISRTQLDLIFDVISNNSEYFFNHDEYDGLPIPYLPWHSHFTGDLYDYNFTLQILDGFARDNVFKGYAISKSINELEPNTPLFYLFEVIENEFIPLLMQLEGSCD